MVETPPVTSEALAQIAQKGGGCLTLGVVIRGQAGWAPSTDGAVGVPLHCREWDPMDFKGPWFSFPPIARPFCFAVQAQTVEVA